jgi:hypothetical protein
MGFVMKANGQTQQPDVPKLHAAMKARKAFADFSAGGFAGKPAPKNPHPKGTLEWASWDAAYSRAMTEWFAA